MLIDILKYYPNLLIYDLNNDINLNYLNEKIREYLILNNDIHKNDKETIRAIRYNEYIIIHAHGTLFSENLLNFVLSLFNDVDISLNVREINDIEKNKLKHLFPIYNVLNNQYIGSPYGIKSSEYIDENVKNLCKSMDKIPGVKVFASCDGHNGKKEFFVCYTCDNLRSAEIVCYYITSLIEKLFSLLDIVEKNKNEPSYFIALNKMFTIYTGLYFKFSLYYEPFLTDKIYKFSNMLAEEIEYQVNIKNFGIKNDKGFYDYISII